MTLRPLVCQRCSLWFLLALAYLISQLVANAQRTNLYSTGFELPEFTEEFTLIGQGNWTGTDIGGNGIVTNFFLDDAQHSFGFQQAYVGFYPLTNANGILNVWEPVNFDPIAASLPIVRFSVSLTIYDTALPNTNHDCFRWSVYNTDAIGTRLFTLDFDNLTTNINYLLDDDVFVSTGYTFERTEGDAPPYDLVVTMNFADNLWSATLNGVTIVDSKRITTKGSHLDLGDIDAVWVNRRIGAPGDNFMVFDNYAITAEPYPIFLVSPGIRTDGSFALQLNGETGRKYAFEVTTNFTGWTSLGTNTADTNGTVIFVDPTAPSFNRSFYRARLVP